MSKPYKGPWVLRSLLFVPGHIEKMVRKSAGSDADCVVLDLEDAVPQSEKVNARKMIFDRLKEKLFTKKTVFVRINPLDTGLTLRDLEGVACEELHGFVYPMANTDDDIKNFDAQLRLIEIHLGLEVGHFSLIVLIETPLGVINVYKIAKASDRVVGLLFGCEDYLADMQARHAPLDLSLHFPRSQVAIAARAAGVEPIDTPYVQVHDQEGLREFATHARDLGMAGMLIMTPRQLEVCHQVYTPGTEEVKRADAIVSAAEDAKKQGRGIVVVDGNFISPPTVKAAYKVLQRSQAIENLERFQAE